MDLTPIITACIGLIGAIITSVAIPYIKVRKGAELAKIDNEAQERLERLASTAVLAAQQIFTPEQTEEKKQYAMAYLEKMGLQLDFQVASAAIEAEVYKMKMELKKGA